MQKNKIIIIFVGLILFVSWQMTDTFAKSTETSNHKIIPNTTEVKYNADEIVNIKDLNRIQEIESKCNQAIEAVYPIYKQINITNLLTPYTEEDRDVMKAFIDSKRAICHKAIADGTRAEDVDFSDES